MFYHDECDYHSRFARAINFAFVGIKLYRTRIVIYYYCHFYYKSPSNFIEFFEPLSFPNKVSRLQNLTKTVAIEYLLACSARLILKFLLYFIKSQFIEMGLGCVCSSRENSSKIILTIFFLKFRKSKVLLFCNIFFFTVKNSGKFSRKFSKSEKSQQNFGIVWKIRENFLKNLKCSGNFYELSRKFLEN